MKFLIPRRETPTGSSLQESFISVHVLRHHRQNKMKKIISLTIQSVIETSAYPINETIANAHTHTHARSTHNLDCRKRNGHAHFQRSVRYCKLSKKKKIQKTETGLQIRIPRQP